MRQMRSFKAAVPLTLMLVTLLLLLPAAPSLASTNVWDFSNPSDYSYDSSLVEVSGGTAHSKTLDLANGWWTKTYSGSGNDEANGVSCDASGNPVVAGYTYNGSTYDIWVRKYSGTDGSTLWTETYGSSGNDAAYGVSCDASGNPVVAGYTYNGSNNDIWVRKYSGTDGSTLWTKTYDGGSDDYASSVSCDASGNPVVAGTSHNGSNNDIWVRKYSGTDGSELWTKTYDSGNYDRANGVSCDGSGNPVVAGYITRSGTYDIWVRKYSGTDGSELWTKTDITYYGDWATGVSCDGSGNPVVAGYAYNGSNDDIWVRKYSGTDGSTLWTKTYNGGGYNFAYGVSCDGSGNPVVVGRVLNGSTYDIWVRKYSGTDGSTLWTKTYDGGSDDYASSVSCDASGNPVVAGYIDNGSNDDIWVRKYPPGDYGLFPSVKTNNAADLIDRGLTGFSETAGAGNAGSMTYQLSPDESTFYYHDGSSWVTATDDHTKSNTATEVNSHIADFNAIATSQLYVRAYLNSNGMQYANLDAVTLSMVDYHYTVTASGNTGGTVAPATQEVLDGGDATPIQIDAGAGYRITDIDDNGSHPPITDLYSMSYRINNVSADHTVQVTFTQEQYTLTINTTGEGTVTRNPDQPTYTWETSVQLRANASSGWEFSHWSGDLTGDANPATISMTGNKTVTAYFAPTNHPDITSIFSDYLSPGDTLTIRGKNFGAWQGTSSGTSAAASTSYVLFNQIMATEYEEWADTEIKCKLPQGALSGPVTVVTPQGVSNADFTVTVIEREYPVWYLAEGSTAWGFDCYISIENPNNEAVDALVTFMKSDGENVEQQLALPPTSQTTVNPRSLVGEADFSTEVKCLQDKTIAVDRTMTWTGEGAPSPDGHCSIGTNSPQKTWYLAEGCSDFGFETWLLIQNPNDTPANCTVTYMTETEGPLTFEKQVGANSRSTFNMEADIGKQNSSIKVESNEPVICERAMYRNNRREGHASIGTPSPGSDFYLAEGTTAWGFTTFVLVQNPNPEAANVEVTYLTPGGIRALQQIAIDPGSRKTIAVNDVLPGVDFSTHVHSDKPIVAERAMYWGEDTPLGEAAHCSMGLCSPRNTFLLPDGQTSGGRETWTLVANPNDSDVEIEITYLTLSGEGNVTFTDTLIPHSRKTYNMAGQVINGRASIKVRSLTEGKRILVERATYWNSRGAGTDTMGGFVE